MRTSSQSAGGSPAWEDRADRVDADGRFRHPDDLGHAAEPHGDRLRTQPLELQPPQGPQVPQFAQDLLGTPAEIAERQRTQARQQTERPDRGAVDAATLAEHRPRDREADEVRQLLQRRDVGDRQRTHHRELEEAQLRGVAQRPQNLGSEFGRHDQVQHGERGQLRDRREEVRRVVRAVGLAVEAQVQFDEFGIRLEDLERAALTDRAGHADSARVDLGRHAATPDRPTVDPTDTRRVEIRRRVALRAGAILRGRRCDQHREGDE